MMQDSRLRGLFSQQMIVDWGNVQALVGGNTEGGRDAVFLETMDEYPSGNATLWNNKYDIMVFERYKVSGGWKDHGFAFDIE
ncbi:unnamed protein product [Arabidopsis halleri]